MHCRAAVDRNHGSEEARRGEAERGEEPCALRRINPKDRVVL